MWIAFGQCYGSSKCNDADRAEAAAGASLLLDQNVEVTAEVLERF
jgi:hypothetical protein